MGFITINIFPRKLARRILKNQILIFKRLNDMSLTLENFQTLFATLSESLTNVEEDVAYLTELLEDALAETGLDAEAEAEIYATLEGIATRVASLAAATADRPEPPADEPEGEE